MVTTEQMQKEYTRWIDYAVEDTDVAEELKQMAGDYAKLEDAFTAILSLAPVA